MKYFSFKNFFALCFFIPSFYLLPGATNSPSAFLAIAQEKNAYTTLNALYLSKQYSAALENIQTYLLIFPKSERRDEILYKLGDTHRQLNQPEQALTIFSKLLTEYPNTPYRPYALLRQAELQPIEESLPLLQEIIQTAPNPGLRLNAQFQTVQLLQKLNRAPETIPYLETLTQTTTNNPYQAYAHLALGIWHQNQNNLTDALDHYRQALTLADTPALRGEAGVRAGSMALSLKQEKEAVALFETVRRLEIPDTWRQLAHLGLLRAQYLSQDYLAVIETYNALHQIFSKENEENKENREEIYYYLANAFRFTNKNKLALQTYETLLNQNKNQKNPYRQAAQYERLLILASEAKSTFSQEANSFLKNYPKSNESQTIRYLLAETLFQQKKWAEAVPLFEIIAKEGQPKSFLEKTYYQLAWSYLLLSQDSQAVETFDSFLQHYPKTLFASESLWQSSLAHERLNQLDLALTNLEQILKNFPNALETEKVLLRKGIILNQQQKWSESRQILSGYLDQYPKSTNAPTAQFYRGLAAFEQKDYPSTLLDLSQIRNALPEFYTPSTERLLLATYSLNQFDKANDYLQDLDQSTKTSSWTPSPELLFGLGQFQQKQKKWAQAEILFERAEKNASSNLKQQAQLNRGLVQLEQKKFLQAVKTLEPLQKIKTLQNPDLLLPLAQAYLGAEQLPFASQLAEQIMLNYPEGDFNANARLVLAEVLMRQKQFNEAAKYYTSVTLLYDDTNLTLIALKQAAEAYRQAGNLEEAKRFETDYKKRLQNE